jgi:hypothetical protein
MSECSGCGEEINEQDTSILATEDSQFLCGSCNECDGCRGPLNEHTSDFEQGICEDCIDAEEKHAADLATEEEEVYGD